ncbi:MAG TPA: YdaS family helix-turn-helix protein [Stellaceae bacterium]|nr:YdaS family helix-turn-helix protein [Stellaceae bacterium]
MAETSTSDEALADRLGVDRSTVSRIRRGTRQASATLMRLIYDATGGAVTANDLVHAGSSSEAAA